MANNGDSRGVREQPRDSGSGLSAQIREAKGLALELKSMLKRKDPWDRTVEYQRESLRKTYLRIIFTPPSPTPGTPSLGPRAAAALDGLSGAPLRARGSSSLAPRPSSTSASTSATQHTTRTLDLLNLLWLDTSHALIGLYRACLSALDKEIAAAPAAHKSKNRGRGGNGGDVQLATAPPPGPVARRKLVHTFRQFLSKEEDFWRTICGRLASRLLPEEADELRSLGIIASAFSFSSEEGIGAPPPRADDDDDDEDATRARRTAVLPLVHKALICFGDLARYSELYSEEPPKPAVTANGRGRGGKGGKQAQQTSAKVRNFSKAAECYTQARLLRPDNGNPSNQLAVLAQYASDSLSSVHHYYRALAVRQPFTTAKANLQITFKKAVARWFAEGGGASEEGEEAARFKAAFVTLMGVAFTKVHLADFSALSDYTSTLFRTCIEERQLTSDVVVKIVVTSLSALWDARMSRTSVASKASSLAPSASAPAAAASTSTSTTTESHLLLHLLSLYTILLRASSSETNELSTSNSATSPLSQNISAVLRRALPALRVLTHWLRAQLEYLLRVEARLEASEERRRRRARKSGGTAEEEEAQRSLGTESSGRGGSGEEKEKEKEKERVGVKELREAMDDMWAAMADYGNLMLVAFPPSHPDLPSPDALVGGGGEGGGVWLEEDVELLGFVPLRKSGGGKGGAEEGRPREIRRVGRDVHPNEEQLMRVSEGQKDVRRLAESSLSRFSFIDGAYIFQPRDQLPASQQSSNSFPRQAAPPLPQQQQPGQPPVDEDAEMLDLDADVDHASTEDDPVDRAMRIDAADKLDMDGLESEEEYDEDEEDDDDDDEQILFEGNRSGSNGASPAPNNSPFPPARTASNPYFASTSATSAAAAAPPTPRTAADLRQQLFNVPSPLAGPTRISPSVSRSASSNGAAVPLYNPPSHTSSPALSRNPSIVSSSIWAPPVPSLSNGVGTGVVAGSPIFHATTSSTSTSAPLPLPPVTPRSFESIPNVTHDSPAAQAAGWGWSSVAPPGLQQGQQPAPLPPSLSALPPPVHPAPTLFGGSSAFAPPPPPQASSYPAFAAPPPPQPAQHYQPLPQSHYPAPPLPPAPTSYHRPDLPLPAALLNAFNGVQNPTSAYHVNGTAGANANAGAGTTDPFGSGPFSSMYSVHGAAGAAGGVGGGGRDAWPTMPRQSGRGNGFG